MGYDLHIVKTEHWLDAALDPIIKEDVDRLLDSAADLAWSLSDFVEEVDSSGERVRYYAIVWQGSPAFYWEENEIKCSNPDEKQIVRMVEMARTLGAKVIGDDGETYQIKKGFLGKKKLVVEQL